MESSHRFRSCSRLRSWGPSLGLLLLGCPGDPPPVDETTGATTSATEDPGSTTGSTQDSDGGDTTASATATMDGTTEDSADTTAGETDGPPVVLDGPCDIAEKVGRFDLARQDIYTTFSGAVADGVVPVSVLELVGEQGGCRLLRRNNPFCDPPCGPGDTCDFDGSCIPYPQNHDVGTVTVDGLLQAVVVDPVMPTYEYFDTSLPHPAWDPDAPIELQAAGGDFEAFELHGYGVEMIEPVGDALVLEPGADLLVEWVPGDGPGMVRVQLNIDQHGITPVDMACRSEDTGSLVVPAAFVDELVQYGVTGFPSVSYYRETVDSVQITPGCVEFGVRAHQDGALTVVGHTPCIVPEDCPAGTTCNIAIQTCE